MAEYIEREAALNAVHKWCDPCGAAVEAVLSVPAADVAPVVHARWKHIGGDEWGCTACGTVISTEGSWEKPEDKYCRNCGAKMDKEGA